MFCSTCGKEINDKANFCPYCGKDSATKQKEMCNITYEAQKHWWFFVPELLFSVIFWFTIIVPIFLLVWVFLKWKLEKLEYKNGNLYVRTGVISIDEKIIPLNKISSIHVHTDLLSKILGFGAIVIKSSAENSNIEYPCIKNPHRLVDLVNEQIRHLN